MGISGIAAAGHGKELEAKQGSVRLGMDNMAMQVTAWLSNRTLRCEEGTMRATVDAWHVTARHGTHGKAEHAGLSSARLGKDNSVGSGLPWQSLATRSRDILAWVRTNDCGHQYGHEDRLGRATFGVAWHRRAWNRRAWNSRHDAAMPGLARNPGQGQDL